MSSSEGFDYSELDEWSKKVLSVANKTAPKEVKKFLRKEGNKLKRDTLKKAEQKVNKQTGNYYKGIKRGRVYKYPGNGGMAIRVYNGTPSYHGHLLEYGHIMKDHKGREIGFVQGYHVYEEAAKEFDPKFAKDVDKFIDKLAEEL